MVFYRKYRPQNIEELDNAWIRQNLGAILSSGKIPHALLFTGSRGLGKTSAARIVAKSVNCTNNAYGKWHIANGEKEKAISHKPSAISQFEPCNKCGSCVSITEGRNLDVLEIDAASNRGIDEIRDLREKIKLAPTSARYKVYIIDEVHMLTPEAFNALLKTLEEPPAHAIFILCTTEVHKLPQTIISRCVHFDFKRAVSEDLIRSLERVAKGESLKIDREVLREIAVRSEGSFRDAVKILEQAVLSGGEITSQRIKEILGETQNLKPEVLLELISKRDVRGAISEINRIVGLGENLRVYNEKILAILHRLLMVEVGVEEEHADLTGFFEKDDLVRLIDLFSAAYNELKTAVIPQLPLELAVVEWCGMTTGALRSGVSATEKRALRSPASDFSASDSARKSHFVGHGPSSQSRFTPLTKFYGVAREDLKIGRDSPRLDAEKVISSPASSSTSLGDLSQLWPKVIEAAKEYNHTIAGVLRGCRPQNFDGRILTIEAFYKFHRDKLNEPKIRELLDKAVAKVLGENIGLKCVLGAKGGVAK